MIRKSHGLTLFAACFLLAASTLADPPPDAEPVLILESAGLGVTGLTGGAAISRNQFLAANFTISKTTVITSIGGHLAATAGNDIFGVIVEVPSADGTPAIAPLDIETAALAATVFNPPVLSEDFRTNLCVRLRPGNYALVLGSGLFGASGGPGVAINEGENRIEGNVCYSSDNDNPPAGYPRGKWSTVIGCDRRFIVEGIPVNSRGKVPKCPKNKGSM